jgi:hypothetical protein
MYDWEKMCWREDELHWVFTKQGASLRFYCLIGLWEENETQGIVLRRTVRLCFPLVERQLSSMVKRCYVQYRQVEKSGWQRTLCMEVMCSELLTVPMACFYYLLVYNLFMLAVVGLNSGLQAHTPVLCFYFTVLLPGHLHHPPTSASVHH